MKTEQSATEQSEIELSLTEQSETLPFRTRPFHSAQGDSVIAVTQDLDYKYSIDATESNSHNLRNSCNSQNSTQLVQLR